MFIKAMITITAILNAYLVYLNIQKLESNKSLHLTVQEIRNNLIMKK